MADCQCFLAAATAVAAAITAVVTASAVEEKNDNNNPDYPFATIIATIIEEHSKTPFYIYIKQGNDRPTLA